MDAAKGHLPRKVACAVGISHPLDDLSSDRQIEATFCCFLQGPDASKRDQFRAGTEAAGRGTAGEEAPVLPHHASFPETAAELVLDLTVEGRNAGMAPDHVLCHTPFFSSLF